MLRRALAAALIVLVPLILDLSGALSPIEHGLAALRMHLVPRAPTGEVVLVDIDPKSIGSIGTWPWPRHIHAELIDRLVALGAAEIAFDVDFSTRSNPADDAALSAALDRAGGSVILATFVQRLTGDADKGFTYNHPLGEFADKAWTASVNVRPDGDGVVRSATDGIMVDGNPIPSIPMVLSNGNGTAGNDFLVDFSIDAKAIDRISAIDVLRGTVARSRIAGKKVIVGSEAVELHDFFNTPAGVISGNLLEAMATETLLQGRALHSTGGLAILAGLIVIALAVFAIGRVRWYLILAAAAVAAVGLEAAATILQASTPIAMDTAPWLAACFVLAATVMLSEIDLRQIVQNIWHVRATNAESLLARVVDDNFAGILVIGDDGSIRAASRAAADILGVDGDLVGGRAAATLPAELNREVDDTIAAAVSGNPGQRTGETILRRSDGAERILEYVVTPSRVGSDISPDRRNSGTSWVTCLTFSDVTRRRAADARIAHMARFDSLTELPNRNQLIESLEAALGRGTEDGFECAVVCFDLDGFKNVNDTLGHVIGDRLLCEIARRAQELLPPGGLVARFGGDEFAAVIAGQDADQHAAQYASRLVERIGEPFQIGAHRVIVSVSIGIALTGEISDVGDALSKADIALYRAKTDGGNNVIVFEPDMLEAIAARQRLELELWQALDRNEFEVWYQPLVDLADYSLIGAEALLRWRHPERGLVSPDEFIPVAEAIGLIEPLGRWVLETACMEAAHWPIPIKLSVNVSSQQFIRSDVVDAAMRVLARSGLAASRLDLEITESLFMEPSQFVQSALARLRMSGIGVVLDDFGTGYSSLSYIQAFPVDKIKIDKSFVSNLPLDQDAAAIVRAVATLATDLGVRLNAEGIENRHQADLLALLGVNEGQGYLFGKPQPAAEFMRLIEAQIAPRKLTA